MDKAKNKKLFENVYRTRDYIVKQELYLIVNAEQNNAVLSVDTYYRRTLLRDSKYLLLYKDRYAVLRRIRVATHRKKSHRTAVQV